MFRISHVLGTHREHDRRCIAEVQELAGRRVPRTSNPRCPTTSSASWLSQVPDTIRRSSWPPTARRPRPRIRPGRPFRVARLRLPRLHRHPGRPARPGARRRPVRSPPPGPDGPREPRDCSSKSRPTTPGASHRPRPPQGQQDPAPVLRALRRPADRRHPLRPANPSRQPRSSPACFTTRSTRTNRSKPSPRPPGDRGDPDPPLQLPSKDSSYVSEVVALGPRHRARSRFASRSMPRPPRSGTRSRPPILHPLKVFCSARHALHHVRERGYVERPARVDVILKAIGELARCRAAQGPQLRRRADPSGP